MKSRAKIGNRSGSPAYRTPSTFRYQKNLFISRVKAGKIKNPLTLKRDGSMS